ncbi:MAG TPA: hypothetical protein VGR55_01310 [Candidatus Acidoferrum sp.]|nr:hypothetical protein [Candidatus Acidoferrum sp.]
MRAGDFSSGVLYRQWTGPFLDSTRRLYVISEPVAKGWHWKLLQVSFWSSFPANEALYLFAIPPALARRISDFAQTDDGSFFSGTIGGVMYSPPLRGAVLLSEGGPTTSPEILSGNAGAQQDTSVNGLMRQKLYPVKFSLPGEWALLAYQSAPGGGGSGNLSLQAMILPVPDDNGEQPYKDLLAPLTQPHPVFGSSYTPV